MNLQDSYVYRVEVEWTKRRAGVVKAEGLPDLSVSAPPEFSGEPGRWTPEHLLLAATASCLMSSFLAVAEAFKLPVASYRAKGHAKLEKPPGEGYRFTEITLVPEIGVAAEDMEKAQRILSKAERSCFISNSLRASVHVEPQFVIATSGVAR